MNPPLHIGDRLSEGFEAFLNNAVEMILAFLIVALLGSLSCGICMPPLVVGYQRMQLRIARGEKVEVGDVFDGFQQFGPALIMGILIGFAIVVGMVFLIIPGLIVAFLCYWAFFEMADGNDDFMDCIKKSVDYNMANIGPALVFMIVVGVVSASGSLVALGSLVTGPIAIAVQAHGWKAVKDAEDGIIDTIPQPVPTSPTPAEAAADEEIDQATGADV